MVNQSLRSRLMFMAILPALMAALVVGGYSLVNRLVDVRDTNAQRQQLVTDSFAARLESTPITDTARQQQLLRQLLEAEDVRAATLNFSGDNPTLHAGPRLRPVTSINQKDSRQRLVTDTSWQLTRNINPGEPAILTVEFTRQGEYVSTLEGLITVILVMVGLMLLAMVPALRFSHQLTNPIGEMVAAVRRIRDGDLSMAIHTQAKGELADLET
ncbi:HAMP domain-containing protein, partial [Alcanivorax jadensis]